MSETRPPLFPVPLPTSQREIKLEDLFSRWVGAGAGRSMAALARDTGISTSELVRHARTFFWMQRLEAISKRASERTMEDMAETIAAVNVRHLSKLRALQEKAFKAMEHMQIDKPADAIRLMVETLKLERTVLGVDKGGDESLAEVLTERVKRITASAPTDDAAPHTPDFEFDPNFTPDEEPEEKTETDGP